MWVNRWPLHSELGVIKCSGKQIRSGDFPSWAAGKITRANFYLRTFCVAQVTVANVPAVLRSEPRRIATWPDNAIFTLFWEGYFISWQTGLPVDIEMFYLYELLWCPSEDSLSVLLCNHSLDMEMCHPYELNLCVSEDCFSLFIFHSIDIVMFAFHCCL